MIPHDVPQGRPEIFDLFAAIARREAAEERARHEELEALRLRLDIYNRAFHAVYGETG